MPRRFQERLRKTFSRHKSKRKMSSPRGDPPDKRDPTPSEVDNPPPPIAVSVAPPTIPTTAAATIFSPTRVSVGGTMGQPMDPAYLWSGVHDFTPINDPLGVVSNTSRVPSGSPSVESAPPPVLDLTEPEQLRGIVGHSPEKARGQAKPLVLLLPLQLNLLKHQKVKKLVLRKSKRLTLLRENKSTLPKLLVQGRPPRQLLHRWYPPESQFLPETKTTPTVPQPGTQSANAPSSNEDLAFAQSSRTMRTPPPATLAAGPPGVERQANLSVTPPPPQPASQGSRTRALQDLKQMRQLAFEFTMDDGVPGVDTWGKIKTKLSTLNYDHPASYMEIWRLFTEETGVFQLEGLNRPTESFHMYLDNVQKLQEALDIYLKHSTITTEVANPSEEIRRMSEQVQRARTPTFPLSASSSVNRSLSELENEATNGTDEAWNEICSSNFDLQKENDQLKDRLRQIGTRLKKVSAELAAEKAKLVELTKKKLNSKS